MKSLNIVWFKRDLRVSDHFPLLEASRKGNVVPLFVFEPSLCSSREYDATHFEFVRQSLMELDHSLRQLGGRLAVRIGELPGVFEEISKSDSIGSIFSHEETGLWQTYERDQRISKWCREKGIAWNEFHQNGVVRKLRNRDGWAATWARRMVAQQVASPSRIDVPGDFEWGRIPTLHEVMPDAIATKETLQRGGESVGLNVLESFLSERGSDYRSRMSSPISAETNCSRLSPYIAWGNLSIKQVKQSVDGKLFELHTDRKLSTDGRKALAGSLRAFSSRLSWHCHFMQKLESEPEIEFQNICRAYDGLRENEFDHAKFEAWKDGRTGFPMIDACMRYLHQNRWINFRMRAMLMSFAAYHLWLHWREPSIFLAKHFLDFEPGIHFPQCQMQSGVTGINTFRIYSPAKQLLDQDPNGEFVRRWVPELEYVPMAYLAEPFRMGMDDQLRYHCRMGVDYPMPIVDDKLAVKMAKDRIYAVRRTEEAIQAAQATFLKHGSQKNRFRDPLPGKKVTKNGAARSKSKKENNQLKLPGFDDV